MAPSVFASEGKLPQMTGVGASVLLSIALFSSGFRGSQHFLVYEPVRAVLPVGDSNHYVWDCGAIAIMIAFLGYRPLYRLLSQPWAAWLGVLSFPIYVVHEPILLSLGAASFLHGVALFGLRGGAALAVIVTVLASMACAIPLAWADQRWCAALGRFTRFLFVPERYRLPAPRH